jgi:hypothetical protein
MKSISATIIMWMLLQNFAPTAQPRSFPLVALISLQQTFPMHAYRLYKFTFAKIEFKVHFR